MKLGPAISILESSTESGSKCNVSIAGSIKSSTILNVKVLAIVSGNGSNNLINKE